MCLSMVLHLQVFLNKNHKCHREDDVKSRETLFKLLPGIIVRTNGLIHPDSH